MSEELKKADILLRVVSKALDLIIIAAAWELLPRAGFYAGIFYMLVSDGLFSGRSIAKKIIGLQVISLKTKLPCTMRDSIIRNLPIAAGLVALKVPLIGWIVFSAICLLEIVLISGSEDSVRIGDMIANTAVVVRDDKTEEKQVSKLASMEGHS
ncbi:MAG: RDD family protein [Nitrospirota bacterium]|nr:MAG: RDD family protein [Nitrospirota bacterium]